MHEAGTERVEAFSDSVMAVVITIMAFNIKPPPRADLAAVQLRLPSLMIYVLSFVFIGIYWNNHHHLMRSAKRISDGVMWANLHLLFWLSLMPMFTAWVGDEYRRSLPAAAYGLASLGAGVAYAVLIRAIISAEGEGSGVSEAIGSDAKGLISLAVHAAGAALAFVSPWISYLLYLTVAVIWFIPDRRFARTQSRTRRPFPGPPRATRREDRRKEVEGGWTIVRPVSATIAPGVAPPPSRRSDRSVHAWSSLPPAGIVRT